MVQEERPSESAIAWTWSQHATYRAIQRAVPEALVQRVLAEPETSWVEPDGTTIYRRGAIEVAAHPQSRTILSCWYQWHNRRWNT